MALEGYVSKMKASSFSILEKSLSCPLLSRYGLVFYQSMRLLEQAVINKLGYVVINLFGQANYFNRLCLYLSKQLWERSVVFEVTSVKKFTLINSHVVFLELNLKNLYYSKIFAFILQLYRISFKSKRIISFQINPLI